MAHTTQLLNLVKPLPTAVRTVLWAVMGDSYAPDMQVTVQRVVHEFNIALSSVSNYEMGPYLVRMRNTFWRKMTHEQRLAACSAWLDERNGMSDEQRQQVCDAALTLTTRAIR